MTVDGWRSSDLHAYPHATSVSMRIGESRRSTRSIYGFSLSFSEFLREIEIRGGGSSD